MSIFDRLLGAPLPTHEENKQHIGPMAGIPVLGLDALSSAAYGPEAALTLLLPLGALGLTYIGPISALIIAILSVVYFSYRQTIAAYPNGGGSYTVAKENLGPLSALGAGAALALDYVLNVAVGISAGVGALVSAVPALQPHTLALCLLILTVLTIVNLRGIRESGLIFMVPTYAFVAALTALLVVGIAKAIASGGHPTPVSAPPAMHAATELVSVWLVVRAFASGCTAMTGVEAVSNGVPLFKAPAVPLAQRTLTAIVVLLVVFLAGIAYLCRAYGVMGTDPGQDGYQSVLSLLLAAVFGHGIIYFTSMAAIVAVLALSANTSFADFPRLFRVLAEDRYVPSSFVARGRRLVYSQGILLLSLSAGTLLIAFGGITDRLIPLFAIGAFLAFTLSQAGMVVHWRRLGGKGARSSLVISAMGACATGATLVVVAVSKFAEGAWLTMIVVPLLVLFFLRTNKHYRWIGQQIATSDPMEMPARVSPVAVLAAGSWTKLTQRGLRFALRLTSDVYVVQIRTERDATDLLADNWALLIGSPARMAGIPEPTLVTVTSDHRQFFKPFVDFVLKIEGENPERDIVVIIPDLVMSHWYEGILHNNRGALLRTLIRRRCSSRVVIVDTPFHLHHRTLSDAGDV